MTKPAMFLLVAVFGCGGGKTGAKPDPRATPVMMPAPANPEDRFRRDDPIPFTPVPGEASPARPCGPKRRGPCLLLAWEFYNFAWGYTHSAWFIDTDGNEYDFSFDGHGLPGPSRPEDLDLVRRALIDQVVSDDDFAGIVAVSTARPRRVTPVQITHALSLLAASRTGSIRGIRDGACLDGGGSGINGYLFDADKKGSSSLLLTEEQCDFLLKENASLAARELAQWVHQLRGTPRPIRGPR